MESHQLSRYFEFNGVRFGASQLAGGELRSRSKFPRASSPGGKRSRNAGPHSKASHAQTGCWSKGRRNDHEGPVRAEAPPYQTHGEKCGLGQQQMRLHKCRPRKAGSALRLLGAPRRRYHCFRYLSYHARRRVSTSTWWARSWKAWCSRG
jgi:hypothetical protein